NACNAFYCRLVRYGCRGAFFCVSIFSHYNSTMGSAPSTEVQGSQAQTRRVASVPDFRGSGSNQAQSVSRPTGRQTTETASKQTASTSQQQPAASQQSSSSKPSAAPRIIRGGRADAIPEVRDPNDIIFETFYHSSGKNFTCMFVNDVRYYLDSYKTGEWLEFPLEWYSEGALEVDDVLGGSEASAGQGGEAPSGSNAQAVNVEISEGKKDEREGVIKIPGKGVFQTYIFEHRRNVHCYYDPDESAWIKLPLKWELKTDVAKKLVRQTQELCPQWRDECDLLASLRASNYNVEDCINTFHATQGTYGPEVAAGFEGALSREKSIIMQNENYDEMAAKLTTAERKLERREVRVKKLEEENNYLKSKIAEVEELLATTKAECSATIAQVEVLQRERPVTAKSRGGSGGGGASAAAAAAVAAAAAAQTQETISKDELKKLYNGVKSMHKVYLQLVSETKTQKEFTSKKITELKESMKRLKQCGSVTEEQIEEVRTLYRREALQRKLLYNQLQELRGNIRVFCRVRNETSAKMSLATPNDQDVVTVGGNDKKMFQFDRAFGVNSTQDEVYSVVSPIITSCADGYNVSIMAYGQTGSGKTYTMLGPSPNPFSNPGVNVRAIQELFRLCAERKDTTDYTMHISMVEIYNECIQDLLRKDVKQVDLRSTGTKVTLVDITEQPIGKEKDILDALDQGTSNRKVAATKMNSQSSRSHLVLILTVIGKDLVTGTRTKGTLTLCDLAGSERVGKTGATGEQLAEAAFINKSLTSLGQVFAALRDNQLHVPYRNSKLTHLLMPSLGGDAKACLFVNVSPNESNLQETLSTLLFGVNARQVALGQAKKNVAKK
ncbi:hypothetical protein BOX15_Mlig012450g1, partial [Macrostomum lignano]